MLEARERVGGRVWSRVLARRRASSRWAPSTSCPATRPCASSRRGSGSSSATRAWPTGAASRAAATPTTHERMAAAVPGIERALDGRPGGAERAGVPRRARDRRRRARGAAGTRRDLEREPGRRGRRARSRRASRTSTRSPRPSVAGGNQGLALAARGAARRLGPARLARRADRVATTSGVRRARGRRRARRRRLRGRRAGERARPDQLRARACPTVTRGALRSGSLRRCREAVRPAERRRAAERRDVRARALLDLDRARRGRRGPAGRERLRRLRPRARAARASAPARSAGSTRVTRAARRPRHSIPRACCSPPGRTIPGSGPPTRPRPRPSWPGSPPSRSARSPSRASIWAACTPR